MAYLTDYSDFLIFMGALIFAGIVIYLLIKKNPNRLTLLGGKLILEFVSDRELERLLALGRLSVKPGGGKLKKLLLAVIIAAFVINQILIFKLYYSKDLSKLFNINITITRK